MQVKYGQYAHEANEVKLVRFDVRPRLSPRGQRMELVYRAHLRGELKDTGGQSALTTKINALIAAYDQSYQDFIVLDNSGVQTPHSFLNSDPRNVSGNRVVYRSWDGRDPAEYVVSRSYEIVVQAIMAQPESGLLYLNETVANLGTGGQVWSADNTFSGPQATIIYPSSWVTVVQSGTAIGYSGYPGARPPIMGSNFEHEERQRVTPGTPVFRGNGYTHYPISWHYEFSTIFPGPYSPA